MVFYGFVGKNLIDELLKTKKFKVFASLYKNKKKYSKEVKYYHVDLRNFENCKKVTKNKDIVFMCAAISSGASDIQNNPLVHFKNNIFMNLNVLDAATKNNVRKIVFLSSNTVYPPTKRKMKETKYEQNAINLLRNSNSALLSTISISVKDYPFGSYVSYVSGRDRTIYLYLSDIAEHTKKLFC